MGESHYRDSLRSLFPAKLPAGGGSQSIDTTAILLPEPSNKHDPNAVMVLVQGKQVGYLARDDAARYAPILNQLIEANLQPETVCNVWGHEYDDYVGTDRRGRSVYKTEFSAGVRVVLEEPHLCLPTNPPPTAPFVMLPFGGAVQVTGEENHLDAITPVLRPEGQSWAYVTLHPLTEQLTRSSREVLEIRIDDCRIGQLTPKMSGDFLPAVRLLESLGYQAAAQALVTGNRLKAEVTIYAERAHQLSADWPNVEPVTDLPITSPDGGFATGAAEGGPAAPIADAHARQHQPVPPRPTRIRFNPPPGWPAATPGAEPPPGWMPPAEWPIAPQGWDFWVVDFELETR
ncbi:hypothetical protein GCM10011575_30470 [Microlunatus endophyticus]|uniref:HIRAN domain-containing protein n=1 Tax=Microlunatus endophyticus TaxID=1716077 RepID=A0A917W595_9ACTN|nr:hypothetical protein GCM10011575_30470 [Microlunatus endophyticus]